MTIGSGPMIGGGRSEHGIYHTLQVILSGEIVGKYEKFYLMNMKANEFNNPSKEQEVFVVPVWLSL